MNIQKIKKLGNRINLLGKKIEECEKNGMSTRIQKHVEELDDAQKELASEIEKALKQI